MSITPLQSFYNDKRRKANHKLRRGKREQTHREREGGGNMYTKRIRKNKK